MKDLLSGDNLQKIIAVLVIVAGGGNYVQNKVYDDRLNADIDRAVDQIHELHTDYKTAMERQQQMIDLLKQGK